MSDKYTHPLIISVVRDELMFINCLANNPHCGDCEIKCIDNKDINEHIPILYNRTLNNLDYSKPRWLIFCHEDFKPNENLVALLDKCDPHNLYGPIGGILVQKHAWRFGGEWIAITKGCITESNKDGTDEREVGNRVPFGSEVESFDCQCLFVHSSLIKKYNLRFDENLSFDFYVEDFCLTARRQHGIKSFILPFNCHHFSKGNIQPRFFAQKDYLDRKYPDTEAWGSSGYNIGGGRTPMRRVQKRIRKYLDSHARFVIGYYFKLINAN